LEAEMLFSNEIMFSGWILIGFFFFTATVILALMGAMIGFGIGWLLRRKEE
jgi:hypothetical protein